MEGPVSGDVREQLARCGSAWQLLAEQEEGPYRRGEQPARRNITEDRPGSPLWIGLRLRGADGEPLRGADVEVWHCDAAGRYSGYPPNDPAIAVDAVPQPAAYVTDETFLRGRQRTDESGDVEFHTIYPGWYPGRTVHIHLMVHAPDRTLVSQLYFPDDVTGDVFSHEPYSTHGEPDTTHATDGIFATGGQPAVLELHRYRDGHVGVLCLVLPGDEKKR